MSYGHAASVLLASGKKSPATELRVAIRRLGAEAAVNPDLRGLYEDFRACQRDLDEYLVQNDPPHQAPAPGEPAPREDDGG